ncbi:hypothetical protein Lery_1061 [Legionella erythra]|uniref:Prenyltransferase and squalene oxidase repeat protein n=2 Tax=Legionella erythra TaxID=448 RepID=A0A0W0TR00_LEGER|nr:hypothetical protein Lery_1061 [Legionella erythra]
MPPAYAQLNEFELCFGLDFFLKAGMDATDPLFTSIIKKLLNRLNKRNGIGFSSHFPLIDADDTATGLYAASLAGYPVSPEPLLAFFNGRCFHAYQGERTPSISVNLHALAALNLFKNQSPAINEIIDKSYLWIKHNLDRLDNQIILHDKWHTSCFYGTSRAVFCLYDFDRELAQNCINWLTGQQRRNGGWGAGDESTYEETAYVVLALCFWGRKGYPINNQQLTDAFDFLNEADALRRKESLWIDKVLYCPTLIRESAILAARYALSNRLSSDPAVN